MSNLAEAIVVIVICVGATLVSVKIVLETFYDKVVEGGFVVLDDYWRWPGCREAVTDYLREHQIQGVVLKKADLHGVYFQKPSDAKGKHPIIDVIG